MNISLRPAACRASYFSLDFAGTSYNTPFVRSTLAHEVKMTPATPDWLTRHDCSLQSGVAGQTFLVLLGGKPHYLIKPLPLGGKFGCNVTQTINGKRLDAGGAYPSLDEALQGGLEDLRKTLGW
jgi:hypothetical protein